MEDQWLVGNHAKFADDGLAGNGKLEDHVPRLLRRLIAIPPATNKEHGGFGADVLGSDNGEPMLPGWSVYFIGRSPPLGCHVH